MVNISPELKEYILKLDKARKLKMLKQAHSEGKIGEFLKLLKVYLDAPISEGGISSDEISEYLQFDLQFSQQ